MNRSKDRRRGRADQAARQALARLVDQGQCVCPRCGQRITADQEWDAGHVTDLGRGGAPSGQVVAEHASCNRSAGGKLAAELRRGRRVDRGRFLQ